MPDEPDDPVAGRIGPPDLAPRKPPRPASKGAREEGADYVPKRTFTDLRNERFDDQSRFLRREHVFRLVTAVVLFAAALGWMAVVAGIVVAQGAGRLDLSEKVVIALLVTTTFNVLGLLATAVRYFFPRDPAVFGQRELPSTRPGGKPPRPRRGRP